VLWKAVIRPRLPLLISTKVRTDSSMTLSAANGFGEVAIAQVADAAGEDDGQQRIVAAHLASVHRVLFADSARRILAAQPRDEIRRVLANAARRAFDRLEPSLGGYGVRA
jgi:hypothetical protein